MATEYKAISQRLLLEFPIGYPGGEYQAFQDCLIVTDFLQKTIDMGKFQELAINIRQLIEVCH